jgi:hypothetical protein
MFKRSGREMTSSAAEEQIQEVFTVTIAASGREHRAVRDADVFSWNELPELLAAEDLFEVGGLAHEPSSLTPPPCSSVVLGETWGSLSDEIVRASDDDDFDDDEDEDEDDEDEDDLDEDEEDDEDEDEEEWEEVEDEDEDDDEDDEEEEGDEEEDDDEEEEDEDWEDDDEDWEDDDEEDEDEDEEDDD